ncbi:MAG: EamA family transporter [Burkholderiaceae bacterium]
MNRSLILLILANVAMTSLAQIILKFGMSSAEVARNLSGGLRLGSLVQVLLQPWVMAGLVLYFAAAVVWLLVLSKVDVSLAYPFVGLGFVVTMLLAWFFLGEAVTVSRIMGTLLISVGVAILALR